jgi:hypothetical protein
MPTRYEGISDAKDPEAGFRAAAKDAVEKFKADAGEKREAPVRLRVVDMYVSVQNPIHDYRVVLQAER